MRQYSAWALNVLCSQEDFSFSTAQLWSACTSTWLHSKGAHLEPILCCSFIPMMLFSCSNCCDNLAGAGGNFWFNTASGGMSLYLQRCHKHLQYSTEQMLQWKNVHYLYLPNAHGRPYWAALIQESSTLIREMWLINYKSSSPGGIHINLSIGFHLEWISDLCSGFPLQTSFII